MKSIMLTRGKFTIVDDESFPYLSQFKWHAKKSRHTWYAARNITVAKGKLRQRTILMHRELMGYECNDGNKCDHINGKGLDNRIKNIRPATNAQNGRNRRRQINNVSGFIGAHQRKDDGRCLAYIDVDGKRIHLGRFDNLAEAARCRDVAALKYHGEFARLNFPSIAAGREDAA